MKINIESSDLTKEAELYEGVAPQTVKAVLSNLPIEGKVNTWGDEIYFQADIGKTPMSSGDEIVPAGPVNVIGKVTDAKAFKQVKDGDSIKFFRSE